MDKWHPGDLVWCKLRGFAELWPGIVVAEEQATAQSLSIKLPDTHLVSFFPDSAFQWVPPNKMFEFEEGYDRYSKMEKGLRSKMWRQGVEEAKELADINAGRVPVTHHFSDAPPGTAQEDGAITKPRPRSSSVEAVNKSCAPGSSLLPAPRVKPSAGDEDPPFKPPSSKKSQGVPGSSLPKNHSSLKKKRLAVEEEGPSLPPKKKISKPTHATAPTSLSVGEGGGVKTLKPVKLPRPRPASALSLPSQPKKVNPIKKPSKLSSAAGPSQPPLASASVLDSEGPVNPADPPPPPPVKRDPWTSHLVPTSTDPSTHPPLPPVIVSDKHVRVPRHPRHSELKPYHSRVGLKRSRFVMTRALEEYCEISNAWFLSLPPSSSPYADWAGYLRACGIISEPPPPPPPPPAAAPPPPPADQAQAPPAPADAPSAPNSEPVPPPAADVIPQAPSAASRPSDAPPPPTDASLPPPSTDEIPPAETLVKDEPSVKPSDHPPPPPPPPPPPLPPPAIVLKPCTASEALSWLKSTARGDALGRDEGALGHDEGALGHDEGALGHDEGALGHDLDEGQVEFAQRLSLLADKKARSNFFEDLATSAPPPAVATGAGNMDPSLKRTLMHVARVALPSSIGAAIVSSAASSSSSSSSSSYIVDPKAQPLTDSGPVGGGGGVEAPPSLIPVHVVLRINGEILPFISPASLHPPPPSLAPPPQPLPQPAAAPASSSAPGGSGVGTTSTRGGGQYQIQGLQGALACFNPCTKFIEGWQLLSPPGLLLLSLQVPDMSKARVPKPPNLPPRPTLAPRAETQHGQAPNPLVQKHRRQGLGDDSGADSDTSRGNSSKLNRVLKKARQVVNARSSPMKPYAQAAFRPYDPSKPFEFHFHPYAHSALPQSLKKSAALSSPLAGGGGAQKKKRMAPAAAVEPWESFDLADGEDTEEDGDIEIEGMSDDEMDGRGRRRGGSVRRGGGGGGRSKGGGLDYDYDYDYDEGDEMDIDDDEAVDGLRAMVGRKSSSLLGSYPRSKASLISPHPFSSISSAPSFSRPSVIKPTDLPEVFIYKGSLPSSLVDAATARAATGPPFPSSRRISLFPSDASTPAAQEAPQLPPPPSQLTVAIKVSDSDDEEYEVVLNNTWGAFYSNTGPSENKGMASVKQQAQVGTQSTLTWAGAWNRHLVARKGTEASEGGGKQQPPLASPLPSPSIVSSLPAVADTPATANAPEEVAAE